MRPLLLFFSLFIGWNALSQETKTSLGFSLAPNYSSISYVNDGGFQDIDIELIKSGTTGELGLSGNFFFQYELMDKLFVTWGLGVQNYRYARTLSSEGGSLSAKYAYSQYYIQFNTDVKYRIVDMLYVRAGVGVDLLAEARYKFTSATSNGNAQKGNDGSNLKEAMVPISLGVGYELKLSDRLNLMTELFGAAVVTDALDLSPNFQELQRRPYQLGCKIGIIRSF